jgi:hypothetical protein
MSGRHALNGRVATEADIDAGAAIFCVPDGRSVTYQLGRDLPLRARVVGPNTGIATGTEVEILQAEIADTGDILVGFVNGEQECVCKLHEIELID